MVVSHFLGREFFLALPLAIAQKLLEPYHRAIQDWEIIEIMAHALVLSNFAPHVLKDLAKLPVRLQDEIRAKATTIADNKKKSNSPQKQLKIHVLNFQLFLYSVFQQKNSDNEISTKKPLWRGVQKSVHKPKRFQVISR